MQVDTAFVGRLGVLQLAALGPNGALFNVVFFLGFSALGVVATNQISAAHGAGDRRAAGQSLILSCTVAFVLGMHTLMEFQQEHSSHRMPHQSRSKPEHTAGLGSLRLDQVPRKSQVINAPGNPLHGLRAEVHRDCFKHVHFCPVCMV